MAAQRVPAILSTFGNDSSRARRTDPESSHFAADRNDVPNSVAAVLEALRTGGPQTDERLVSTVLSAGHTYTPQRIRTARAALVKEGTVMSTGRHGRTERGYIARVWALTVPPATFTPELFGDDEAMR